jgi:hypothetical protein
MHDNNHITYFAETDFRNKRTKFGIKAVDRLRHMYVIGKTGMGKSTMLENMAIQDIQNGEGLAFLDPHGTSAQKLLDYVPEHRIDDVLYFNPADTDYPVAFNVMEDVGPARRHLVASGLMSAFKKIWVDVFSARMEYILTNTLLALLEYPGSTMLGVNRMLSDKDFRSKVVANITDPAIKSFWVDEFGKYTERFAAEATPAIQNKVGQYSSNPLIRNIIGQPKSSFDLRDMMDKRKIIIVNLAKGLVGETNTALLGSMLTVRLYLAAMSRADVTSAELARLPNFYFYIDEFQSIANASFADILSEARKYKLNLTLAHQYVEQMPEELQAAVFGNIGTSIAFRVGPLDAELMEKQFAPKFMAQDFINLGFAQIYLSLMIDGVGSAPFSAKTIAPIQPPARSFREEIIRRSREQFAKPRAEVEEAIIEWHKPIKSVPKEAPRVAPLPRREPPHRETPQVEKRERPPFIPKPVVNQVINQNNPSPANISAKKEADRKSEHKIHQPHPTPISLKELAQKENKAVPSKNLEELRRILSELKPATEDQKKPAVPSTNSIREDRGAFSNGVKEVPEDELRKMVSIDDE